MFENLNGKLVFVSLHLQAGQRIVNMYADTAIMLLLPELEKGLFDDNWRIRYSSVQLLGDLLYRISGVSGKMSTETADEDDNFGTEQSHHAIIDALGGGRRNRVLAGLYMGRSDVALMVRQAALHVWKVSIIFYLDCMTSQNEVFIFEVQPNK